MKTTLNEAATRSISNRLSGANASFAVDFPGDAISRQPVHTLYGGAHLFRADLPKKLGAIAERSFQDFAPDAATLGQALGLGEMAAEVRERVAMKLATQPIEDFRIDFEDGFGTRPDSAEDLAATEAARELARGAAQRTLPPFIGIRVKSLAEETRTRAIRTLDLFLTTLVREGGVELPQGFVITLPKVTIVEQVEAMAELFDLLEQELGLAKNSLRMELMIETPQSIVDREGRVNLSRLARAGKGRIRGAHFGAYDYTAQCNVASSRQTLGHPTAAFARQMMQLALAGTGIFISDGATNVLPVAPHRASLENPLKPQQVTENRARIHEAWRAHYDNIRSALDNGFYQGWDLHPAQLPVRHAAVFAFFLEGLDEAARRLRNFIAKAAQATLSGSVFDDAATGQGLLNFFLRAEACGAMTEAEVEARTGMTIDDLRLRSFAKILDRQRS